MKMTDEQARWLIMCIVNEGTPCSECEFDECQRTIDSDDNEMIINAVHQVYYEKSDDQS